MKGYPQWFNAGCPPLVPYEPQAPLPTRLVTNGYHNIDDGDKLGDLVDKYGRDSYIDIERGYYDEPDQVVIYCKIEEVNPYYDRELKAYEKKLAAYEKALATHEKRLIEWKELKTKYNAEKKSKEEAAEKAQLQKLLKKYGDKP